MITQINLRELALRHWNALSLDLHLEDRPLTVRRSLALFAAHLLGLLAVVRLTHQPLWLALFPILLIQPLFVSLWLKRRYLIPESFAPLIIAYAVVALRLLVACVARVQGLTSGPLVVPEPWGGLLNLHVATGLSGLWALMAQAGLTAEALGRRVHGKAILGCALAVSTLAWAGVTYFTVRTKGVTGSDPYAYVQMGVDIAQYGTPLHIFPLAPRVAEWGLPVWPLVPVGYNPPNPVTGAAATVWAPGYSALLALSYRIWGETGLYILTPLLGLVTLVAVGCLCLEVLEQWKDERRFMAAGIAVFVLATSYEQVDRVAVPMADIPAQLFSTLTVYFALRTTRGRIVPTSCLAGLFLGAAFATRYTQVLLGISVLAIWAVFFYPYQPGRRRALLAALAGFGATAWLVALPVLWYHTLAFGGPFRVGWSELDLFRLGNVWGRLIHVTRSLLNSHEFLYLFPFLGWGLIRLWRDSRRATIGLLVWLLVIVLFHLPYAALRLRDLLSVFPALSIWVGVGIADALCQIQRIGWPIWRKSAQGVGLGLVMVLLSARSWVTLPLSVHAKDFSTFGYLRTEQRAAFDFLARLTTSEAVVASSLNSGPIELYTAHAAVRPASWSQNEWLTFLTGVLDEGRKVYLLLDGVEMHAPARAVQSRYQLSYISSLSVPYFYPDGSSENLDVPLYEVIRRNR